MAVVGEAQEMADSPTGAFGWKGDKIERTFLVRTDSLADGPITVYNAEGLPGIGDVYETAEVEIPVGTEGGISGDGAGEIHEWCICKDIQAKRMAPRSLLWKVVCSYETTERTEPAMDIDESVAAWADPLEEAPIIKVKNEIFQRPVLTGYDEDNNETVAIANSAGDLITPPYMRDSTRQIITITKLHDITEFEDLQQRSLEYENTINSDYWWNAPPHAAKIQPFDMEVITRSVGESAELKFYLRVTYTIAIQWPDWDIRQLDYGANYISLGGIKKAFKTKDAHCFKGLLDGDGHPLGGFDEDGLPEPPDLDVVEPVFLDAVQIYEALPFADLDLPQSILPPSLGG